MFVNVKSGNMDLILNRLNIVNYKNVAAAEIECSPRFNCFIGNNGAGKTNVLDAVYHLSMCKSYFNLPDGQNIRHGESFFVLDGRYEREDETLDIYCGVKRGQKKVFKRNKKSYERLSDHIGLLPLVVISPVDTVLIDGMSEERRRFVDGVLSQCDKEYLRHLIAYNRALMQRNALLKEYAGRPLDAEMLAVWDEQLADHGTLVLERRRVFARELAEEFQAYYARVSLGREQVTMEYTSTVKEDGLLATLRENRERDRVLTYTSAGIHRDDIALRLEGYPVKRLGSQGQKKSFLTALKFAQFAYLSRQKGIRPLLLLDDIFDKLDAERVNQIIDIVASDAFGQIFITDTNRGHIDEILREHASDYKIFKVNGGEVK